MSRSKRIPKLTLGMRMLIAMHSAGYSTGEMAKKLKVSRHSATGWLYGRHQPNHSTLVQWSEICDVDQDWLINGEEVQVVPANDSRKELVAALIDALMGGESQQRGGYDNPIAARALLDLASLEEIAEVVSKIDRTLIEDAA